MFYLGYVLTNLYTQGSACTWVQSMFACNTVTCSWKWFTDATWNFSPQTAEKDEYEHQQKEVEKVCNPIITKLYQSAGGMPGGMPDGMPGGFPGAGAAPGGGSSGPTIEEVD